MIPPSVRSVDPSPPLEMARRFRGACPLRSRQSKHQANGEALYFAYFRRGARSRVVQLPNDAAAIARRAGRDLTYGLLESGIAAQCSRFLRRTSVEAPSPVILGERDDVALLGVVTLESLALVLNPYDRTLHPMRTLLAPMKLATTTSVERHAPR